MYKYILLIIFRPAFGESSMVQIFDTEKRLDEEIEVIKREPFFAAVQQIEMIKLEASSRLGVKFALRTIWETIKFRLGF